MSIVHARNTCTTPVSHSSESFLTGLGGLPAFGSFGPNSWITVAVHTGHGAWTAHLLTAPA